MSAVATRLRLWAPALIIFGASRIYSTFLLVLAYGLAKAGDLAFGVPLGAHRSRGLLSFLSSWDATYYRSIALQGYPTVLPRLADGTVAPNNWAFLPLFPEMSRVLAATTGLDFDSAGIVLSVICGAVATVLVARLVAGRVGERAANWTAAAFAFGPVAFVLQLPYAESLFCLLIFACLAAVMQRRYLLALAFAVLAAFTRPGELAIPLMLGILYLRRLREPAPFSTGARVRMVIAGVGSAAAGLAWPLIAATATSTPSAYVDTELSWWRGYVGRTRFVPFAPWFELAGTWLGIGGVIGVVLILGAAGWALWSRPVRDFEPALRWFSVSYFAYLVCVLLPQQSLVRMLLPLSPLLGVPWISASRARRRMLLALCVLLQPVGVVLLWTVGYP